MHGNWDYLDKMDKNILYLYARGLLNNDDRSLMKHFACTEGDDTYNETVSAEGKCKAAFYIIHFVFRHVLKCETYEQAEKLIKEDNSILDRYNLSKFVARLPSILYIGVYNVNEVTFYKPDDIFIILEILYNRYDYFEQFECMIRRITSERYKTTVRQKKCKEAIETALELMKDRPEYETVLERYYARQRKANE